MAAVISLAASAYASAQTPMTPAPKTGYAQVNGLNLYYEIHGAGRPLVLLHGGLGSIEITFPCGTRSLAALTVNVPMLPPISRMFPLATMPLK